MKNPYLTRQAEAPSNAHGKRSEQRLAKTMGSRLTPASGATAGSKGDAKLKRGERKFLIESKSTTNKTLPLEHAWLVKIEGEALNERSMPVVTLSFVDPQGKPLPRGDWVLMPRYLFDELTED